MRFHLAALSFLVLSACDMEPTTTPVSEGRDRVLGTPRDAERHVADSDQMFFDAMIPHHKQATDMAKLASERAEHAELRAAAARMVADQQREIEQMQAWRAQWYPDAPDAGGMDTRKMETDMQKLKEATGAEFDRVFLEQMIQHHEMGVQMAKKIQGEAKHPEVAEFAGRIVAAQEAEIATMKEWKQSWM
jgi:uncharacterized protein (DUF305 family)